MTRYTSAHTTTNRTAADTAAPPAHGESRTAPTQPPAQPARRPRFSSRAAVLGAAALALSLSLTACSSSSPPDGEGKGPADGPNSSAPGSAYSPSPTPAVAPAAYRRALAEALGPLDSALRAVDGAQDGGPLNKALDTAAAKADTAARALQATTTPNDALTGNGQLASSLSALAQDLRSARGSAGRCSASPRVALGRALSPQRVEQSGRALTALGYDATLRLPRTERTRHRRLANGAFLRDGSRGGLGRLTIKNGTGTDAVMTLTRGTRTAFSVYVRSGSEATVRSVNSGSYTVYFTTGEDWNGTKSSFTRECRFEKFDDRATFRTVRVAGGTQYTVLTFSLNKVLGGNAGTSAVPPGEFPS
ncbi:MULTISPECIES: hypothetical protein [unclassified Streptomyces]|uniref:hypothetical protein n=1 Tax=unclassified Streptomyces TaxID=2593676 RepID=UPI0008826782|nr:MULTISPECIES: hypothetical protein [unclassified Streptomyces]PBC85573.1 hypothetical protein BX261_5591 [Streptomyces sp. 2321.6]SDR11645.1 hypothetical protein SAMN05216511_1672 [Streptomyces sp. KS_16]SED72329.1 hypothetical protein SAMN05428940_5617 [Streptomyces sp. 2133.1]SEE08760.1 hypothetical protein SAMN05428954_1748 [Streptomyces sp. 2112.3]SNC72159.1 hypothetical protein SAMN06272741_5518 [Streptomyces sp. 2114.4]